MGSFLWSHKWWVGYLPKIQVQVTKGSGLVSKNSCLIVEDKRKRRQGVCMNSVTRLSFDLLVLEGYRN